jgi:hypothetical protein
MWIDSFGRALDHSLSWDSSVCSCGNYSLDHSFARSSCTSHSLCHTFVGHSCASCVLGHSLGSARAGFVRWVIFVGCLIGSFSCGFEVRTLGG